MIDTIITFISTYAIYAIATLLFVIVLWMYVYFTKREEKDDYMRSFKRAQSTTKKSSGLLKSLSGLDGKAYENKIKDIQASIFNICFSTEVNEINNKISELNDKIRNLKSEEFTSDTENINERQKTIEDEIETLEIKKEELEQELSDARVRANKEHQGSRKISDQLDSSNSQKNLSFIKNLFRNMWEKLDSTFELYGYLILAFFLLAGDYYIIFQLFNDFLKVQGGITTIFIYIASGIIPVVFVVLLGHIRLYATKQNKKNSLIAKKLALYSIAFIGVLLLLDFLLIILVPLLEGKQEVIIDVILRLLFIPLIIGVDLLLLEITNRNISIFAMIIRPFALAATFIALVFAYIAYIVNTIYSYIYKFFEVSTNPTRKITLAEINIQKQITTLSKTINSKRQELTVLSESIESNEVHQVTVRDNEIDHLENVINTLKDRTRTIRRASDNAVLGCL